MINGMTERELLLTGGAVLVEALRCQDPENAIDGDPDSACVFPEFGISHPDGPLGDGSAVPVVDVLYILTCSESLAQPYPGDTSKTKRAAAVQVITQANRYLAARNGAGTCRAGLIAVRDAMSVATVQQALTTDLEAVNAAAVALTLSGNMPSAPGVGVAITTLEGRAAPARVTVTVLIGDGVPETGPYATGFSPTSSYVTNYKTGHPDWFFFAVDLSHGSAIYQQLGNDIGDFYLPGSTVQALTQRIVALIPFTPDRFLRVDWGDDRWISRIDLKMSGEGSLNAGVSLESSLGFIAFDETFAPDVLIPHLPLWEDNTLHSVLIEPPLLARGVRFYPDILLLAETTVLPEVLLSHLVVYETVFEGETVMSLPTEVRSRVGVQQVKLYPHNGATGPYDATTACEVFGLQELDLSKASKTAQVDGGETIHPLGAHETSRITKVKVSNAVSDLRVLKILLGGDFEVDLASGGLGEVQYWSPNFDDRSPYFRLWAKSTNGDGTDSFVFFKCKVEGNVSYKLNKDQVTNLEFEFTIYWDRTAAKANGETGGIVDWIFGAKGETTLHS